MMGLFAIVAVGVVGAVILALSRRHLGERPGPGNNWRNEDHIARENDGTWTEGSRYSKSSPPDSSGLGIE